QFDVSGRPASILWLVSTQVIFLYRTHMFQHEL
ncbi:unnamed protein product, partial [Allacma fusca]